jgi:hypothetical protein
MRLPADSVLVLPEYAELLLPDLRRARERHRGRGRAGFEALLDELIAVAQELPRRRGFSGLRRIETS